MAPSVSVLMPVHDAARYVGEAVESVLQQTYRDFEFIIIDDGSEDGSRPILRRYAREDERIRLFERAHQGFAASLNDGLHRAEGKYIARMDADDRCRLERFERQVAFLEEHPEVVALGTDALRVDDDGLPICPRGHVLEHEAIEEALLEGNGRAFTHPTLMIRRDAALRVGAYDSAFTPAEDVLFVLRLGEQGRLANLPDVLLDYRMHLESMCHSDRHRHRRKVRCIIQQERRRRDLPEKLPASYRREVAERPLFYHLRWAWTGLRHGHGATARKHLGAAFRLDPLFFLDTDLLTRVVPPRNILRFLRRHLA